MAKKISAKKKRTIILVCVLVVALVAGIFLMTYKRDTKLDVETVTASKQTIDETLDTIGTVSAASEDTFVLPQGVKVLSLNVKEGDAVEAGTVLATFDISSLTEALNQKESAYEQAQAAYKNAVSSSKNAESKIDEVKAQIAELEKQIAEDEAKTTTSAVYQQTNASSQKSDYVTVSDSLVKRFMRISKLFGVEYSEDAARRILINMLSAGSSTGDISSLLDNLTAISSGAGSFDMSAFTGMTSSSNQVTLIQLKAQLSMLEMQSNDMYISAFKTIADKTREAYSDAQKQIADMKDGWKAESKGIISEINISENGEVEEASSQSSIDISSILSAVTSGGDITSMLSSFMNSGTSAMKILYYPLVADIALSKYDVLDVELNQDVVIKTAGNTLLDGKVTYISPVASSSDGINISSLMGGSGSSVSIPAQITINGVDRSVIVGVDIDISIITDTAENCIAVPVEAVCIDGEDVFVYTIEDGKAVRKNIELGIFNDSYYQVISGVNVDDVLIKNTSGLKDGVKVNVK